MSKNINEYDDFRSIEEAYWKEWDYDRLGNVLNMLEVFDLKNGKSIRSEDLKGHVLNRRGEWFDAYQSLNEALKIYPDNIDLCYWAALNAIDAGSYDIASNLLDRLEDRLDDVPERLLRGIWRGAGVVGNIRLANKAFDNARFRGSELALDAVGYRIQSALRAQSNRLAPIISIGENCQPWMLPNRWGLRRSCDINYQSSMFNLGQSSCYGAAKILENMGDGMVSIDNLEIRQASGGAPRPFNVKYDYDFNHELGHYWISNDYENLRNRYLHRIKNFHSHLSGDKRVFFFYSDRNGDLNEVVEAVIKINKDRNFSIVIIDLFEDDRQSQLRYYDCVSYARLRFPRKDYIWWKPDHHDSDIGVYFEESIRNQLIDAARL